MPNETREFKAEDIGSINLTEEASLRVSIVNDEYLNIRIWVESERYTGPTKKGIYFSLSDDTWVQFKELMEKVDKKHEELVS